MTCPEILRTQAWLDAELDRIAAAEAETHTNKCPECRTFVADTATVGDAIRSHAARWRAPARLHQRIVTMIGKESRRLRSGLRDRRFWYGAATGTGLSALAAAVTLFLLLPPAPTSLLDSVVDAHTRALMSQNAIEVASSNHHTVKPWFAGRIDVSPPVADFAGAGFALAGGRIDRVAGAPAAVVVYRHGAHEIDLFVWADRGATLPRESVRHGYRAMLWKTGDLDFAAVSDTGRAELETFVQLVRAERE